MSYDEIRIDNDTSPNCIHDSRIRGDYYVQVLAWQYYKYHYWADVPKKWDHNKITNQLKNDKTPIYAGGYAERYKRGCWIFKWYTYERGHAFVLDGIQEMVTTYKYYCTDGIKIGTEKEELIHYII